MTSNQRKLHLLIWLILGPLVAVLFIAGVVWRPGTPIQEGTAPGADVAPTNSTQPGDQP